MDIDDVRQLALSLPHTVEQDHHGMPSFRVRGKIFVTVPDDDHIRVMAEEDEIRAAAAESSSCTERYWGKRLACVVVELATADGSLVGELVLGA